MLGTGGGQAVRRVCAGTVNVEWVKTGRSGNSSAGPTGALGDTCQRYLQTFLGVSTFGMYKWHLNLGIICGNDI